MAVVTYEDVAVTLGRPITDSDEQDQVTRWIADAELLIRLRLGDVSLLDQDALAFVEREAVAARLRNPDGVSSEAVDDYKYTMPANSRQVTILDEWWNLLSPETGAGAFSARPYFEADTARWPTSRGEGVYFDGGWTGA